MTMTRKWILRAAIVLGVVALPALAWAATEAAATSDCPCGGGCPCG